MIKFGSVCSGIEAASIAWEPLGMSASWLSEIMPFPSAVLDYHWPQVPNYGDMNQLPEAIRLGLIDAPDVLVGGTPCQAYSCAGLRGGLADPRGGLTLKYVEILNEIDKQRGPGSEAVAVWENVPGVLNSKDNAFGCFLASLVGESEPLVSAGKKWSNAGLVHGPQRSVAWRILDAQFFGVAQQRRRVFVVASARSGFDPASVLLEPKSLRGDSGEVGTSGQTAARYTPESPAGQGETVDAGVRDIAGALCARSLSRIDVDDVRAGHIVQRAPFVQFEPRSADGVARVRSSDRPCPTLNTMSGGQREPCIADEHGARRLTPKECSRLQGFPDDHARIPYKNKTAENCPLGPQYSAYGNSKAVPVVRWIGARLITELYK